MTPPGLPEAFWSGKEGPFLSLPTTQRVFLVPFVFCFSHPGPCCLPPPMSKVASSNLSPSSRKPLWPFLGWFWPGAEDWKDPSIHQSLTDHCRTMQERFWGTSDPWDVWERMLENTQFDLRVLLYALCHRLLHCSWNSEITPLLSSLQLCLE